MATLTGASGSLKAGGISASGTAKTGTTAKRSYAKRVPVVRPAPKKPTMPAVNPNSLQQRLQSGFSAAVRTLESQQQAAAAPRVQAPRAVDVQAMVNQARQATLSASQQAAQQAAMETQALEDRRVANDTAAARAVLEQYGLGSLAGKAWELVKRGMSDPDAIMLFLQETPEWKQRFSANEIRKQRGLGVLSPEEYIKMESTYKTTLRNSGLPSEFANSQGLVTRLLVNDVSPTELADRVQRSWDWVNTNDSARVAALQKYYGVNKNQLAAYVLDPEHGLAAINKQAAVVDVGAESVRHGFDSSSADIVGMAEAGVSGEQARAAFSDARMELPAVTEMAKTAVETNLTETAVAKSKLGLDDVAGMRVKSLKSQQRARFSGSSGGTGALGSSSAGSF